MAKIGSPWQLLFYFSMSVLTVWLILKIIGIIQTPAWLEYGVPIGSLILGLFGLYRDLLKSINGIAVGLAVVSTKIDHIDNDVESLKKESQKQSFLLEQHSSLLRKQTAI